MIFSVGVEKKEIILPDNLSYDIVCFFRPQFNHVEAPSRFWFEVVCASLRNKRDVLILESNFKQWPAINQTQRWQWGDDWMWLAPRALSTISKTSDFQRTNIVQLRLFLSGI